MKTPVPVCAVNRHETMGSAQAELAARAIWLSILTGSHSSSSSRKAIHSPRAIATPALRALAPPEGCGSVTARRRTSLMFERADSVSVSGPSTTTTTSIFEYVWFNAVRTARTTSSARPRVGITALTNGEGVICIVLQTLALAGATRGIVRTSARGWRIVWQGRNSGSRVRAPRR